MGIEMKPEVETRISSTDEGYVNISQEGVFVSLSAGQVEQLLTWLENGAGLAIETDWNNGIRELDD